MKDIYESDVLSYKVELMIFLGRLSNIFSNLNLKDLLTVNLIISNAISMCSHSLNIKPIISN